MTNIEIRELWRKFGGGFYGPIVEHANIKEEALFEFVRALLTPNWQPIETAPKDGTWILAVKEGYYGEGIPFIPCVVYWDSDVKGWSESEYVSGEPAWVLTHWMPIPKNPVELKNDR